MSDVSNRNHAIVVDKNNTWATQTLGTGASVTGTATHVLPYSDISLVVYAEPADSEGTLTFEFSQDGLNWDVQVPVTVDDPSTFPPYPLRVVAPWFRVSYANGTDAALTAFRFQTLLHRHAPNDLTRTPSQTITDSEPVKIVRAMLMGKNPSNVYQNVELSSTGAVLVATESEAGLTSVFGNNPDVDTAATEDIWAAGGVRTLPTAEAGFSVVSDSVSDTSAGTGARTVTVNYLDDTFTEQSETLTMNGVVPVNSVATDCYRVQSATVATVGASDENVGNITISQTVPGTQAYIAAGANKSRLSQYTVPINTTAKFISYDVSCNGATANVDLEFQSRTNGGLWEAFHILQLDGNASTHAAHTLNAPSFAAGTDLRVQGTVSANNMSITAQYTLNETS